MRLSEYPLSETDGDAGAAAAASPPRWQRRGTADESLARMSARSPTPAAMERVAGAQAVSAVRRRGVLLIIGTLDLGGTESQLVLLARTLKDRGWKVEVFSLARGGVLAGPLEQAGIPIFYGRHRQNVAPVPLVGTDKASGPPTRPPTRRPSVKAMAVIAMAEAQLMAHIVAKRPCVVHAALPLTNFIGSVAGRLAFAPLVITSRRGLGNHQDRWPRTKWLDRIANRLSHIVLANSHAVARDTAVRDGYDIGRIQVIPNGLDLAKFEHIEHHRAEVRRRVGLSAGETAIIMVANLIPYKGHRDLVAALAVVAAQRPDVKLFLAGTDRGVGAFLRKDAAQLGVDSKLVMMGSQSDIPALLAGMDLGVIASHEEGFCNALIEKLAAGLPVVATDVGGNPEALAGLPGCELVRPRDPADLARGLLSALGRLPEPAADRDYRRRTIRQRYSAAAMADAYERLYLTGKAR